MLNSGNGAYGYLSGYLDGSGGLVRLETTEVAKQARAAVLVHESDQIRIHAMHVPHGIVPALAFRVSIGDRRLVFSSDQNLSNEHYLEFARGADLLAVHMPLPEGATSGTQLHAVPSEIGAFVSNAFPETLLVSHFMRRSLVDLEHNISLVGAEYDGTLLVAEDLLCHVVE
jgi:ribonuclease BN (tRNA processing enzyme)